MHLFIYNVILVLYLTDTASDSEWSSVVNPTQPNPDHSRHAKAAAMITSEMMIPIISINTVINLLNCRSRRASVCMFSFPVIR